MSGASEDMSAATYKIHDESHTIGNALRWMIMKKYVCYRDDGPPDVRIVSPKVEFCGYRCIKLFPILFFLCSCPTKTMGFVNVALGTLSLLR